MSAAKKDTKDQKTSTTDELTERLEQVFLAGLGALSTATEIGAKTFDSLVDQGQEYRKAASSRTEKLIEDVQDAVRDVSEGAQERASGLIDQVREQPNVTRLHDVFDARVERAFHRLGLPTQKDVDALDKKLNKLIKLIEAKDIKAASKKSTARKTSKKKTTGKKKTSRKVAKKAAAK